MEEFKQGSLTEGEGSVRRLTSLLRWVVLQKRKNIALVWKAANLK